ncbi:MAG: ribonuclease D, partial [Eggerthellaceae bacterium]|nr:ribonuclease D [Eggerthellaceae bacterium]
MLCSTYQQLVEFCNRAQASPVLAIDTEFLREKTYYAKLCLIQLATETETAIVDPLAIRDLSPLCDLFTDEGITKVFHAAGQDLDILYHDLDVLPRPVFDTQVAATLLGYGQQIGYSRLGHGMCGVTLAKTESFTDWSQRPLTASQVAYAEEDVVYLPRMFAMMTARLEEQGRLYWLDEEFADMVRVEHFEMDDRSRYLNVKRVSHLNRRQMSAAREVTAWREATARRRNIPRKWVLADEQIVEICKREPKTIDDLFLVRGIREKLPTSDAREVVSLIRKGLSLPEDQLPGIRHQNRNEASVSTQVDLMMPLVHLRAKQNNIAPQTLASKDELEELARYPEQDCALLRGWK